MVRYAAIAIAQTAAEDCTKLEAVRGLDSCVVAVCQ